jgi:predicted RNA-binding protein with PIN domain
MPRQRLVVDGYNLVYALPELAQMLGSDLERTRDQLVGRLSEFGALRNADVTVVFDGRGVQFVPHQPTRVGGVEVVFSRPPHNADQTIIAMLRRDAHPRSVTVVTSDGSVARSVRDYGAKTISSSAFVRLLSESGEPSAANREPLSEKPEMTPGDVAEWEEYLKSRGVDTSKGWF